MRVITLKMPDDLAARLTTLARRRGVSRSELVRIALGSYLGGDGGRSANAADLALDLIGRFRGPHDLSHHPRHGKSFGK